MLRYAVSALLETYQRSDTDGRRKQEIVRMLLGHINERVHVRYDLAVEQAIKNVLIAADRPQVPREKLERALHQLCREVDSRCLDDEDERLIEEINSGRYFEPLDLHLDTQDGVV